MKKKLTAIILAATLALSMAACGGNTDTGSISSNGVSDTTEKDTAKHEVSLKESGYSVVDNGYGNIYAYWGATLVNEDSDNAASFPTITITAKNEDGSIIATFDQVLMSIAALDEVSFGGTLDCKGITPASVEFSSKCKDFIPSNSDGVVPVNTFTVSNTSEVADDIFPTFTGEIENTGETDLDTVAVTVIVKNQGNIVYGATSYVNSLTAGSKAPFEIQAQGIPEHDEYIISAMSW